MSSDAQSLARLRASAIDGRTESIRYRQNQLQSLHKELRLQSGLLLTALQQDGSSSEEASVELVLGQDTIRHAYDSLDFPIELRDEYSVAEGKDYPNRRVGCGLVVVRPGRHTPIYSVLAPLSAAIAAGNCVLIELRQTTLNVAPLIKAVLISSLDISTFAVSSSTLSPEILESAILVDQTSATIPFSTRILASPTKGRVVAVVDRTGDIEAAAIAISTARFSFAGTSPYAPDLVLVNEYVKEQFVEACIRHATFILSRSKKIGNSSADKETRKAVKEAEENGLVTQGFGSDRFRIVEVKDRASALATMKVIGRYLPIVACSGLVDTIFNYDLGNTPLLAAYLFASPGAAKYLAQHLPSQIACINHIPTHLLVGPPAPASKDPDFHYRYNKDMFSVSRPQFVAPWLSPISTTATTSSSSNSTVSQDSVSAFTAAAALLNSGDNHLEKARKLTGMLICKELPPLNQPRNDYMGFFEQGLVVGMGVMVTVVLPVIGYSSWVLGRKGVEFVATRLRSP